MYREMFMYVDTVTPDRTKYIVSRFKKKEMKRYSCDIVRMGIDLAYFNEDMIRKIEFNPVYLHCEKPTTKNRKDIIKEILEKYPTERHLLQASTKGIIGE